MLKYKITILILLSLTFADVNAQVLQENIAEREGVDVVEHLGDVIPMDIKVTDSRGVEHTLDKFFNNEKPIILSFVYYECPMLCTLVLNGLSNGLRGIDWVPGKEFQVLSISIDERETTEMAADKKARYLETLKGYEGEDAWKFFTAKGSETKRLADAIGFHYKYDEKSDQYLHPAAIFILSPDGKVSRYLYNIEYKPNDLRFGLMEAAQGRFTTTVDKLILYCFHYDPDSKGYVLFARNVMKLGGVVTLILMGIGLGIYWSREKLKKAI